MSNRIYIGRISSRTSERDIEKFFKGFGRIRFMSLKNGYGFVDLEDERDADDAVYELHGKELLGERVIVEHAKGPARKSFREGPPQRFARGPRPTWLEKYGAPIRTGYKLIVENLSSRVSWQDLKDYMRQAGDVTFADAHKEEKNVGVVEFASYADMKKAMEKLDGTEINGRKIKLIEDVNNRVTSRSRSRSVRSDRRRMDHRGSSGRNRSRSGRRSRKSRSDSRDGRKYKRSYSRKSDDSRSRTRNAHSISVDKKIEKNRSESKDRKERDNSGRRKDKRRHDSSDDERGSTSPKKRSRSSSRGSSQAKKRTKNRSYSRDSQSDNE